MIKEKRINEQPIYLNYKRNIKFLGIIDYKSLLIFVVYCIGILNILRFLPFNLEILIYLFCILVVPVLAIFCINLNNESTIDVIYTIIRFIMNKRIFVRLENIKDFEPKIYLNNN